jgi:hypothetical protein
MRQSLTHPSNRNVLVMRARQKRCTLTSSEQKLWAAINAGQLGTWFRRQGASLSKSAACITHAAAPRTTVVTASSPASAIAPSASRRSSSNPVFKPPCLSSVAPSASVVPAQRSALRRAARCSQRRVSFQSIAPIRRSSPAATSASAAFK